MRDHYFAITLKATSGSRCGESFWSMTAAPDERAAKSRARAKLARRLKSRVSVIDCRPADETNLGHPTTPARSEERRAGE